MRNAALIALAFGALASGPAAGSDFDTDTDTDQHRTPGAFGRDPLPDRGPPSVPHSSRTREPEWQFGPADQARMDAAEERRERRRLRNLATVARMAA